MVPLHKPKIAILTLRNTYNYGGVLSHLKIVYQFCEQYFTPTVFFLGFDPDVATNIKKRKFTSSVKPLVYFGMNCVEVGARWSFWEPGHYAFTKHIWQELLKDYTYFFAVSGTCIAAHPLTLLNKKFAMWIGTPYYEDRAERLKHLTGIHKVLATLGNRQMLAIERNILNAAITTFAISSYAYKKFESIKTNQKNHLIQCGFPIRIPETTPTKKERIIVAVGRWSDPRKNIDMLMRVFDGIVAQQPDIKLYMIGVKPTTEKMLIWSTLPSFKNVAILGQISGTDLRSYVAKASLLLITSYQEGFGIVGVEALGLGTPVIATDCGGPSDFVLQGQTGFLVPINDDKQMIHKALQLFSDPTLFLHCSIQGKKLVQEFFATSTIYAKIQNGLSLVYPELKEWFKQCDEAIKQERIVENQRGENESNRHQPYVHNNTQP